jgi:hypothetical protein
MTDLLAQILKRSLGRIFRPAHFPFAPLALAGLALRALIGFET